MTKTELDRLMKKYCILPSELDDVFDFVSDLLYCRRKELEKKEPYAVRSINALENAEHEVYDLIDYVSELEEDDMENLKVRVNGGYLCATVSGDIDYPGICVEFIADNENDNMVSRPTVLVEKPTDDDLRVLVWADDEEEDYTTEIKFN